MRRFGLAVCFLLAACATSSGTQGGTTSNPSDSSAGSNASSGQSAQSSQQSNQSSANSSASTQQSSASNASTQQSVNNSSGATAQQSAGVLAASLLLGTTAATIGLTVYSAYAAGKKDGRSVDAAKQQARAWLDANRLQLQEDLALGAGPSVDDWAVLARVRPEHVARFGALLRTHRSELLPPAELTPDDAGRTMARVGALVFEDAVLRPDGEAAVAMW